MEKFELKGCEWNTMIKRWNVSQEGVLDYQWQVK